MKTITIRHPMREHLAVTVGPASRDDWAAAYNAVAGSRSSDAGTMLGGYNLLCSSARKAPQSLDDAKRIADEWPKITKAIWVGIFSLSGGIAIAPHDATSRDGYDGWHLDLGELWAAAQEMQELIKPREVPLTDEQNARCDALRTRHEDDLAALQKEGINAAALERLANTFEAGKLVCIRTREHGIFLLRAPGFMAALDFASRGDDAFAAIERLAMASVEHPSPATLPALFARLPALATVLAGEAKELLGDKVAAIVKKE